MRTAFLCILGFLTALSLRGNDLRCLPSAAESNLLPDETVLSMEIDLMKPSPLLDKLFTLKRKGKKLNAALLAFPFPCGIVGLHRIYLGTAPYVPVVYIATLGGGLGILPFIDFCVLMLEKDLEPYIRNEKVFMWSR